MNRAIEQYCDMITQVEKKPLLADTVTSITQNLLGRPEQPKDIENDVFS